MTSVNVILDWLLANSGRPARRPTPATEAEIQALIARGAPQDLVNLYRTVGRDLRGLVPDGYFQDLEELSPPSRVYPDGASPRRWQFTEPATRRVGPPGEPHHGWAMLDDGQVAYQRGELGRPVLDPPLASLHTLFERHLQALVAGEVVWHPGWELFLSRRQLPDPDLIPGWVGPHFPEVTQLLVARLQARQEAPLLGLGTLSVYDYGHNSILEHDDGRDTDLSWFERRQPCRFEPLEVEGFGAEAQEEAGRRLAEGVGGRLKEGEAVEWPGLGVFLPDGEGFEPYMGLERGLGLR
jgi:hypothetical protein